MPIAALQIENFKRVSAVYIEPGEGVVEITGHNRMGKSSILDAIKAALGGEKQIPWKAIREGEEEARIEVTVTGVGKADLKVTRTFHRREDGEITTRLKVENEDGFKVGSPQALLSGFLGSFSFDPVAFLEMKPKDQVETLKAFVKNYDFPAADARYAELFDERRLKNRLATQIKAVLDNITIDPDAPTELIDEAPLIAKLGEAGTHNAEIETRRAARNAAQVRVDRFQDAIDEKMARITELQGEISAMQAEKQAIEYKLDVAPPLPDPIDMTAIQAEIEAARASNKRAAAAKESGEHAARLAAIEKDVAAMEAEMVAIAAAKKAAIAAADLPITGLGIDGDIVTFNDIPLESASQAEQIQVSLAIAAAMNPRLKIALVNNGSLLDKDSWAALVAFAEKEGLQVFAETVDSDRPTAIVIEDGAVATRDG